MITAGDNVWIVAVDTVIQFRERRRDEERQQPRGRKRYRYPMRGYFFNYGRRRTSVEGYASTAWTYVSEITETPSEKAINRA